MKRIIISLLTITSLGLTAQTHTDDAIDFTSGKINGTARYRAMGGAMGALGEDLSATSLSNPAGGAVSVRTHGTLTMGVNHYKNEAAEVIPKLGNRKSRFNLTQLGGNFIYEMPNADNKWKRIALTADYERNNILDRDVDIAALKLVYTDDYYYIDGRNRLVESDSTFNYNGEALTVNGYNDKFYLGFSGNYDNRIYLGLGFNFHSAQKEASLLVNRGLIIDKNNTRENSIGSIYNLDGSGISVSLGVIARVTDELRLGVSYQTPTWWRVESYDTGDQDPNTRNHIYLGEAYDRYNLRTAGKLTGSAALVLGKSLAMNADVIFRDYKSTNFDGLSTSAANEAVKDRLRNTLEYRVGAEYRIDELSLRAGYRYTQDPYKRLKGNASVYSVGLGYNFGNLYLSGAYDYTDADTEYWIAGGNPGDFIKQKLSRSNVTLTLGYRL